MKEPLKNPKHELFCNFYIQHFNAHRAYIEAGFKDTKASRMCASNLFTKPYIQRRIQELTNDRVKSVKIDADYVLKRLVEIDELDVIDILTDDGNVKPVKDWPKSWRTSISAFDAVAIQTADDAETVIKKIKLPDKVKNLELLGKHITVKAWDKDTVLDMPAQPLNITFNSRPAVGKVKVTNG